MNRSDFQKLAELRVREAKKLLENNCFEGAYYLLGYAVECAFKACIAKQTKRYDFPDKNASKLYTHVLTDLLSYSGLKQLHRSEIKNNKTFELNWAIVKDWRADKRYSIGITEQEVKDFHSAVLTRTNGVFAWLRKQW